MRLKVSSLIIYILLSTTVFAKSAIIDTTGGKAIAQFQGNQTYEDVSQAQYDPTVTYPVMVKQNGKFYCYTGDNYQFQLYGWQQINELDKITWYYFDTKTGERVTNAWTKDGYYLGPTGRIVPEANNARDWNTDGFKFGTTTEEMTYRFKDGTRPIGCWCALSPLKNDLYYWYYFDYNGNVVKNESKVQGKYAVNKEGQYTENGEPQCFILLPGEVVDETTRPDFTDKAGQSQISIVYNDGNVLGAEAIQNAVIYAATPTAQQRFINQINKDNAVNCDFDLEDRNYYDKWAEDHMGIMRNAIMMNGSKASFKLKCDKYNVYKLTYALEYTNTEPGTNDEYYATLEIYVDGELCYTDDDIYTNENIVSYMDVISEYKKDMVITFTSSNSSLNLIMTAKASKDNSYIEYDEE